MGARGLAIRDDLSADELRRRARREPDRAAAMRMMAIANALEGMSRAEAARLAGMERRALRDAVVRTNAEGLAGLHDRPRPGAARRLDKAREETLRRLVLDGPDVEATGAQRVDAAGPLPRGGGALGRGLPPVPQGQDHAPPRAVLAEGQAEPSEGGPGGAGGLRKGGFRRRSTQRATPIRASA
jgi:hypothetical protein